MENKKIKESNTQKGVSMVKEHPLKIDEEKKEKKIEDFKKDVQDWEFAGVCQFKGWMPEKVVSDEEFKRALKEFKGRKQGGK